MDRAFSNDYFSLADLYVAYRKAKAEAFFDNLHPSVLAFTEYERNLTHNLESLLAKLKDRTAAWSKDVESIGEHLYVPKSIDESAWHNGNNIHFRAVDPFEDWLHAYEAGGGRKAKASFRLIIAPTVEFHIISSLWILKVGHLYEGRLDKNLSFGNRLRRFESNPFLPDAACGELNRESRGLFYPYFSAYRSWREKGLAAMRESVEKGARVAAVTMDLASFFHKANPRFMLRRSFLTEIDIALSENDRLFTTLLLNAIGTWYSSTPDARVGPQEALPVGLSASKVISNVLLYQLDREIKANLSPLYYGRYVDDIFLVLESSDEIRRGYDLMRWLARAVPCLRLIRKKNEKAYLRLDLPYASDSDLYFTAEKQKIFLLSSDHGRDLVDRISSQIKSQSSEYRLLPDVPESSGDMAARALLASSDASLAADALRKADVLSVRRLGFSLLLSDIEAYSRDLRWPEWEPVRREFFGIVQRFLLAPTGVFEFSRYYPRVIALMIANKDFASANQFVDRLASCVELIEQTCVASKDDSEKFDLFRQYLGLSLLQAAIRASTARRFDGWTLLGRLIRKLTESFSLRPAAIRKQGVKRLSKEVLLADLGYRPYKDYWYYDQSQHMRASSFPRARAVRKAIRWLPIKEFWKTADLKRPHWPALIFPTRPLTVQEIALVAPTVLEDVDTFKRVIKAIRGAGTTGIEQLGLSYTDDGPVFYAPAKTPKTVRIALTNIETTGPQFELALAGSPDRSIVRYRKFCSLINRILKEPVKADYVLMPELSVPRRWAFGFAEQLARQGISLIAGIEYYPHNHSPKTLVNAALVSLVTYWPGYRSSILYMQRKGCPSHGEKKALRRKGKKLEAVGRKSRANILFRHGEYYFGVVICSDLTAIQSRVRYQGKVDSLFVLEWNPDVDTFGFLIESAAHDIHTYVAQVNNRTYGDSRLRSPHRDRNKRDSVRFKGGLSDGYVLGEVDFLELRRFQKRNVMTDVSSKFKPVPIGFKMAPFRKLTKI